MPNEEVPGPNKHSDKVTSGSSKVRLNFTFDLKYVVVFLLVVIAIMLLIWKPWSTAATSDRTVSVTGESTLKAVPDEFVFYPSYHFKNADKEAALQEMTQKSDTIVDELVKLGVAEEKIKTDSSGYGDVYFRAPDDPASDETTYTLSLTVTASDKDQAQKVQDYLVTTQPTGSVSPQASFSEAKRNELESQARDQATKDARAKADQSAKNLGFKVGAVKSVQDGQGFDGGIYPMTGGAEPAIAEDSKRQLAVQPGENELRYSVAVVYYVK
jgi:uncharacterized protein YggE